MAKYTDGEITVGFHSDIALTEVEKTITDFGLSVKDKIGLINTYLVEVPVGSEQRWIENFKKLTWVMFAERNDIVSLPKTREPQ